MTVWQSGTLGLSASQLSAFVAFVDDLDPEAYTDPDKLEAARVTFAMTCDPEAYPCSTP